MIHSIYYRMASLWRKGNKVSLYTHHKNKGWVTQNALIESVKAILAHEFIDCGYCLMSAYLKQYGYQINHKKRYRIMKKEGLLNLEKRISRSGSGRKFIKFRKVIIARPFECLEMDMGW